MSSSDFTEHILNTFAEKLNTTLQWVHDNPIQTIALLLQILVLFSPSLVIAPILNALGFAANGVRAGSIAAWIHSTIAPVVARSLFALLQSAGAGGWGSVVLSWAVILVDMGGLFGWFWQFFGKKEPCNEAEEVVQAMIKDAVKKSSER
ncbi:hypothetical protein BLS_002727 [Venturia inaequalis]|uniref:Uncharacterized protein n=1 Tax=Venturia inaequalis TaxID=5025 RepID=A0A8H3VB58_VENIN|nr:hypothetical protein BLS_002727 [Venturia inaequalis]KAE9979820.1 hypothetical protein EG328_000668 [Venturia inaequalis]KAE9983764.1 hypothetical protein EG327_005388 [Venturia inaequalis]